MVSRHPLLPSSLGQLTGLLCFLQTIFDELEAESRADRTYIKWVVALRSFTRSLVSWKCSGVAAFCGVCQSWVASWSTR